MADGSEADFPDDNEFGDGFEDEDPGIRNFGNDEDIFDDGGGSTVLAQQNTGFDAFDNYGASGQGGSVLGSNADAPPSASFGRTATEEDWAKSVIKPDSHRTWEKNTKTNLSNAKALTRHALLSVMDNERIQFGSTMKSSSGTAGVDRKMKVKITNTEDLIKALEDRIESVEDTIRQVGECLFSLQRAHRSKWAPLNVCERRLELRDTRPLQELVKDHTQEALSSERQTLIESRQELADQIEGCKEMLINLDGLKNDLIHDLQHKRHALRIDRNCLTSARGHKGGQDRVVLPQLHEVAAYGMPPSPKGAEPGTGGSQEDGRQVKTKQLVQAAVRLEEDAVRLCNSGDAAMLQTRRECVRCGTIAQASMSKRIDETEELKTKLQGQMQETDEAIAQTEISLTKLKRKLDAHDKPLRTLDRQFAARTRRTSREGIRDQVHEEMETHLDGLKDNVKSLTDKYEHTKDVLDQLKSSKLKMTEDYRAKATALKIDDACMKVTPRKAIELDRLDPRGGRCREAMKKKRPQNSSGLDPSFNGPGGYSVECS